ncbi:MAG: ABC transporter permease subunit [Paracoccaceae bacterium]|nr:ABC transporter permease subunit [Paracoccaceae bacterium]
MRATGGVGGGRGLRGAVLVLVLVGIVLPILAGLWHTARAAFGVLPALGYTTPSLHPWAQLLGQPGFATSLHLTLLTGFGTTLAALILATGFCAVVHGRIGARGAGRMLAPFLAAPHAAMAIGLAFLIAPSGWVVRLISPWLTGWALPPEVMTVGDPQGLALILGLLVKEVPFLLLVILSALGQIPVRAHLATGRALGYGRGIAWIKIVLPQVYPLIRLPVYVVLAFSLSVVDVAIILGPSNPATLAVAVLRWFSDPDTARILLASAGALLQAAIAIGGIGVWWLGERLVGHLGRWWVDRGGRGLSAEPGLWAVSVVVLALMALGALALLVLILWSVAWRWSFPHALPESWYVQDWYDPAGGWAHALVATVKIGCATTVMSLSLAIAWLEAEDLAGIGRLRWATMLIYLPLLLPQIAFLYGLNVAFLRVGIGGNMAAVIWGQLLFVFPYVMITLSDPWKALDRRLTNTAAALGATPLRRLFAVKLPILLRPICTAAAVGFAVSVGQYLPTLFLGAGRISTLTTEAVTLSSGSDRRVVGVYAVLQAALPFLVYVAAFWVPALTQRNRRALAGADA